MESISGPFKVMSTLPQQFVNWKKSRWKKNRRERKRFLRINKYRKLTQNKRTLPVIKMD